MFSNVVQVELSVEAASVYALPHAPSQVILTSPIDCADPRSMVIHCGSTPWVDSQRVVMLLSTAFAAELPPLTDDAVAVVPEICVRKLSLLLVSPFLRSLHPSARRAPGTSI